MKKRLQIDYRGKKWDVELSDFDGEQGNFKAQFFDEDMIQGFGDYIVFYKNQMYLRSGLVLSDPQLIIRQKLYNLAVENGFEK
jgi:hypothetical protein